MVDWAVFVPYHLKTPKSRQKPSCQLYVFKTRQNRRATTNNPRKGVHITIICLKYHAAGLLAQYFAILLLSVIQTVHAFSEFSHCQFSLVLFLWAGVAIACTDKTNGISSAPKPDVNLGEGHVLVYVVLGIWKGPRMCIHDSTRCMYSPCVVAC